MFLSVDIGGTNTKIAISKDGFKIDKKISYLTPKKYDDGIDLLQEKIEELTENNIPKKISVGTKGAIDYDEGRLINASTLINWSGHSLKKELELRLRTKVYLENDAALAGIAEASKRKKYKILAYITLSTGIGGARIINGKIDYHATPFEPGHMILDPNGRFWPGCGQKGCFESMGSGTAFEISYGVKAENCFDVKIWEDHAQTVSTGLVNVITMWTPDILVIGGSLIKAGDKFTKPLVKFTQKKLEIYKAPKIEFSKLGDENVLMGGILLQIP